MLNEAFLSAHKTVFDQIDACGPVSAQALIDLERLADRQVQMIRQAVRKARNYLPPPAWARPGKWVMVRMRNNRNWGLYEILELEPLKSAGKSSGLPYRLKLQRIHNGKKIKQVTWCYPSAVEEIKAA